MGRRRWCGASLRSGWGPRSPNVACATCSIVSNSHSLVPRIPWRRRIPRNKPPFAKGSNGAYPSCFHVRRTFFHGWAGIALSAWRRLNHLTLCIPLRPCSWESPWPSVQMNPNASALNWQHCHYLPVVFVILYDRIYRRLPFNRMLSGMTNTPNQKVPRLWAWAHVTHGTFSHEMTRERASAAYPSNVHWARPRCDGAKKRLRVRRKALEIDADRLSQQDRHRS